MKTDGTLWALSAAFGEQPTKIDVGVSTVAAGEYHYLYIKTDGTLWAFGQNTWGQLGDGSSLDRAAPVQVATNVISVAAGARHTLFVKSDGSLWGMGDNGSGQIGTAISTTMRAASPVQIATGVSSVAAGEYHSLFIKADKTLWTIGANDFGQLGDGTRNNRSTPVQVADGVTAAAAGLYHSIFVKSDHAVWGMGDSHVGQLGDDSDAIRNWPVLIAANTQVVAAGGFVSLFLRASATGSDTAASVSPTTKEIGAGTTRYIVRVASLGKWQPISGSSWLSISRILAANEGLFEVAVEANSTGVVRTATIQVGTAVHTLTQRPLGGKFPELLAMGNSAEGQLGIDWLPTPRDPVLLGRGVRSVAASRPRSPFNTQTNSFVLYTNGELWGIGQNSSGQLGIGSESESEAWVKVASDVVTMAAGDFHVIFVKSDGTLWAAGNNSMGQLGDGTTTNRSTPVQVASDVRRVAAGRLHTLFLKSDGTLFSMGLNSSGQLGDGTTINRSSPVQVATNVASIAAGTAHSLFVKNDETCWGTGSGVYGELGGSSLSQDALSPIQLLTNVSAVAAGERNSFFIKKDNSLWATGENTGDGTSERRMIAVPITTNVSVVAAGASHVLWVKIDGTLWAVGENGDGQLGDGTNLSRTSPIQVATDVVSISGGARHSLFVRTDGTFWAMGDSNEFQWNRQSLPLQVAANVAAIAAGGHQSVFVGTDGSLWGMGSEGLGTGANSTKSAPILITTDVNTVAAGDAFTLFVKSDATLWSMGRAGADLFGSTAGTGLLPVQVETGVLRTAAGSDHGLIIKTDGTLWTTGYNYGGQLGDGGTSGRSAPVKVADAVTRIAGGKEHSLYVGTDGGLWAMGGTLGGEQRIPVRVTSRVQDVAAGAYHSFFITIDGDLWGAGYNFNGELGDGTATLRNSPVRIASDVAAVAAGTSQSFFIKGDGTLWATGLNTYGQLGDGTLRTRYTPVYISAGVLAVAAGANHTLFLRDASLPSVSAAKAGIGRTVSTTANGPGPFTYQWQKLSVDGSGWTDLFNGNDYSGTNTAELSISENANLSAGERIRVSVTNPAGTLTSSAIITSAPVMLKQPVAQEVDASAAATFSVAATGVPTPDYRWQRLPRDSATWTDLNDGGGFAGATEATITVENVTTAMNGDRFRCKVNNGIGPGIVSNEAVLTVRASNATSSLVNIAARGYCSVGDRVMIGGFVVSGSTSKRVLVRAVGPSLTSQGISANEALGDPIIEVHRGASILTLNDDWQSNGNAAEITATAAQIGARSLDPTDLKSSALLLTLNPGVYSFVATGKAGTSGIVLLEVYDADATARASTFVNIATRAYSTTGNGVTIGGFVIAGSTAKQVLLRAVGPTLLTQGIGQADVLLDPMIELHRGNAVIGLNDNWGENSNAAEITTVASRIGATPIAGSDTRSAALLVTLQPGVYSFLASGKSGTSGIVLVEVYDAD